MLVGSFSVKGLTTSLHSPVSSTGWRLQSIFLSSVQSLCTSVFRGLHRCTSSTNFVELWTSRLISDSILPHLPHSTIYHQEPSRSCCDFLYLEQFTPACHFCTFDACLLVISPDFPFYSFLSQSLTMYSAKPVILLMLLTYHAVNWCHCSMKSVPDMAIYIDFDLVMWTPTAGSIEMFCGAPACCILQHFVNYVTSAVQYRRPSFCH